MTSNFCPGLLLFITLYNHLIDKLTTLTQLLAKLMLNRLPTPETSRGESPPLWNSFFVEGGAPVDAMTEARRINKQGSRWLWVHFII